MAIEIGGVSARHFPRPCAKGAHARPWPVKDGIAFEDRASINRTTVNGVMFSGGREERAAGQHGRGLRQGHRPHGP